MQTKQQILAQKLARLDTLESQKRAMLEEYMPIKNEIEILKDEVEELEMQLLSEEQVEDDKRFDEIVDSLHEQALKHADIDEYDFGIDNLTQYGYYKLLGYIYPCTSFLKKYVYKQYNSWVEIPQRLPKPWSHADDENDDEVKTIEENSRFSRILEKGNDDRSLHEIKMQQIKDLESSQ